MKFGNQWRNEIITKVEFEAWKQDRVTKAVHAALDEQYTDAVKYLVETAGLDSIEDSRIRGYLQGLNELFKVELETTEEYQDDEQQEDEY